MYADHYSLMFCTCTICTCTCMLIEQKIFASDIINDIVQSNLLLVAHCSCRFVRKMAA